MNKIVELWTKRKFQCDCGNSKFGEFHCKLFANKDPENLENSYNQNFKGSYCTCGRPYPDPDAEEQVEMIQCCICEDWFHENHLGLESIEEVGQFISLLLAHYTILHSLRSGLMIYFFQNGTLHAFLMFISFLHKWYLAISALVTSFKIINSRKKMF